MIYCFGAYELDTRQFELRCAGDKCPVEPQVFDVLAYLIANRNRVVSKDELLDTVWNQRFVTETTLSSRLMAARRAIGDDGQTQSLIRTLRGRGYRFVGTVIERVDNGHSSSELLINPHTGVTDPMSGPSSDSNDQLRIGSVRLVGREDEIEQLRRWQRDVQQGFRRIVFVTGEAGIGKTTLIDTFVDEVVSSSDARIGRGQCLQQYGAGEAYMPILEAIGRMCRGKSGSEIVNTLAERAPSWLLQMPWLVSADALDTLRSRASATTREGMLREMVEALELLATDRLLLIVLEDLHWSDHSTLDLLTRLAARNDPTHLLILGTYRPADAKTAGHPLEPVTQDLRRRHQSVEIPLRLLSEQAVSDYLTARFSSTLRSDDLVRLVMSRTEGNPLFVSHVIDAWIADGSLKRVDQHWVVDPDLNTLASNIPDTLRDLIEQQIERLSPIDQEILTVASVAGMEWAAAVVAAGVEHTVDAIETRCTELARHGEFIQPSGVAEWPDGTITAQFGFLHHLYRDVLFARIPIGQRVRLHRQIGTRLERGYGIHAPEQSAMLATHFVHGRDPERAVRYLCAAAEQALQRNAYHEAIQHLTAARDVLLRLPETASRRAMELEVQTALAPALIPLVGWAAPDVERAFTRAHELCDQLHDPSETFGVLYGMATMHEYRGEYQRSQQLMEEHLQLRVQSDNPRRLVEAHELLACSLFHQGALVDALEHANRALTHYDQARHRVERSPYAEDLGVGCHVWAAQTLWLLGYPDQAVQRTQSALALADQLGHLYSVTTARGQLAFVYQYRRQPAEARRWADASFELAVEQGFRYREGIAQMIRGWALAEMGHAADGVDDIRRGLESYRATGASMETPYFLALLAEALAAGGHLEDAKETVEQALDLVRQSRSFFYEAELLRIRGSLLIAGNRPSSIDDADACYSQSLDIARRQNARSLVLRSTVSLCRLGLKQGRRDDAYALLSSSYNQFTEGLDTPDLIEARQLLGECCSRG